MRWRMGRSGDADSLPVEPRGDTLEPAKSVTYQGGPAARVEHLCSSPLVVRLAGSDQR